MDFCLSQLTIARWNSLYSVKLWCVWSGQAERLKNDSAEILRCHYGKYEEGYCTLARDAAYIVQKFCLTLGQFKQTVWRRM